MGRKFLLMLPLLLSACATQQVEQRRPTEPLLIRVDHYESMTGISLSAYGGVDNTVCKRDMVTGTHILRWYCTFKTDPDKYQYLLDQHVVMASRTLSR